MFGVRSGGVKALRAHSPITRNLIFPRRQAARAAYLMAPNSHG
ncbi:hypothetical protein SAMN05216288_2297 [Pseudomonas punonensis]|uniref:Uncharacterized protein n=1 Tax=Phytopseudomonas punonensis TaxID=1220495 RepID=A0A1M7CZC5_9GAMM|nr:hypothetical protein SAMN05216288_2297 [Pseudomonas punonensis]